MTTPTNEVASLTDAIDRDGVFWSRDALNERGWFPYPQEEPYLTDAELIAKHGPLTPAVHERHDPPGPVPGPTPGVCFSCGNTGEVYHGRGPDGPVWGGPCGCDTPYCNACGDPWPCAGSGEQEDDE
jgi:hypothetical protein